MHFRAWSLFWAIKLPGTKENHILPRCLTDNSPLNDLLLGVNYANDAQTNSSRGQLRQPLISGQFPSCFTDIQLKNCLRTSALSGARRSWRSAVQRWAAAAQLFDEAELQITAGALPTPPLFKILHAGRDLIPHSEGDDVCDVRNETCVSRWISASLFSGFRPRVAAEVFEVHWSDEQQDS